MLLYYPKKFRKEDFMNKIFIASIVSSIIMFSGCGTTGDDNNTTNDNLDMLNGDNPVITLEGETNIEITLGTNTILTDDRFSAFDPQDGDLTNQVERTHNIDFTKVGVYQVTYFIRDNDGNSDTKVRTVTIVEGGYSLYDGGQETVGSAPSIKFSDGDTIYLAVGQAYDNNTYSATDLEDGDLTYAVQVEGQHFDVNTEGTYTVSYTVTDSSENTVTKDRTVYVGDFGSGSTSNWYDNVDLGEEIDGSTNSGSNSGYTSDTDYNSGSPVDNFEAWYKNTCGQTFDRSLYNSNTGQYRGSITCSNRGLNSIDLSKLYIFSTIESLDVSNNNLTDIDFTQLGLNESNNNTKVLKELNLENNSLSTQNFDLFRPLFYLKNINVLIIKNNNFNYTDDDIYTLRTKILNNKSLIIKN
jgi:hypothetical protein